MHRAEVVGLAANYVESTNIGTRSVDDTGPAFMSTIARRFYTYIKRNYASRRNDLQDEYPEVVELYGDNASFSIAKLRQIGGWDTSMSAPAVGGIEDRDVCFRLRQRFPDHHFYAARPAHLILDQDPGTRRFPSSPICYGHTGVAHSTMPSMSRTGSSRRFFLSRPSCCSRCWPMPQ